MSKFTSFTDGFYTLFKESTIIQGTIALGALGSMLYLYVSGKHVPPELLGIVMSILGYYFGAKAQQRSNNVR
jgi:uncharacterized membrane protein YfcA